MLRPDLLHARRVAVIESAAQGAWRELEAKLHRVRAALEDFCHIALDARGHVIECRVRADART